MKIHTNCKLNIDSVQDLLYDYFDKNTPATFDENENIQCEGGLRRSFYDLLALCSNYFDTNEKEVATCLCYFLKEGIIGSLFCHNIGKVVFYNRTAYKSNWSFYYKSDYDEFRGNGREYTKGKDGLSINDIYNLSK